MCCKFWLVRYLPVSRHLVKHCFKDVGADLTALPLPAGRRKAGANISHSPWLCTNGHGGKLKIIITNQ
jgi:hypothetical protein